MGEAFNSAALRLGFRQKAPASPRSGSLTTSNRVKLIPAGPIVLHAKVCGRVGRSFLTHTWGCHSCPPNVNWNLPFPHTAMRRCTSEEQGTSLAGLRRPVSYSTT
jgi:hypothetical protein